MPVDAAVQTWAEEMKKAGLTEEQLKPFIENESVAARVKSTVMAQSDYSRNIQALKAKETEIAKTEQKVLDLQSDLVNWRQNEAEPKLRKAQQDLENLQAEHTKIVSRLNHLKDSYSIPEEELYGLVAEKKAEDSKIDAQGNYITKDDFKRDAEVVVRNLPRMVSAMRSLEREHERLFGPGNSPDFDALIAENERTGKPLRDLWEAQYKVPEKRQEIESASRESEIEKRTNERLTQLLSEANLPGAGGKGGFAREGSPVLSGLKKVITQPAADQTSAVETSRPGDLARRAAQAWAEGKYRQQSE